MTDFELWERGYTTTGRMVEQVCGNTDKASGVYIVRGVEGVNRGAGTYIAPTWHVWRAGIWQKAFMTYREAFDFYIHIVKRRARV